jgi:hypothetical protein
MSDQPSQNRRPGQCGAKQKDNIFVIAPLETPVEDPVVEKREAATAEKNRLEKIEKEVSRAVEDAVEKSG